MIQIPPDQLGSETLNAVIESFVLREGTDYGEAEFSLPDKIAQVRKQIARGDIVIVYDETLETCNLLTKRDFQKLTCD